MTAMPPSPRRSLSAPGSGSGAGGRAPDLVPLRLDSIDRPSDELPFQTDVAILALHEGHIGPIRPPAQASFEYIRAGIAVGTDSIQVVLGASLRLQLLHDPPLQEICCLRLAPQVI